VARVLRPPIRAAVVSFFKREPDHDDRERCALWHGTAGQPDHAWSKSSVTGFGTPAMFDSGRLRCRPQSLAGI